MAVDDLDLAYQAASRSTAVPYEAVEDDYQAAAARAAAIPASVFPVETAATIVLVCTLALARALPAAYPDFEPVVAEQHVADAEDLVPCERGWGQRRGRL